MVAICERVGYIRRTNRYLGSRLTHEENHVRQPPGSVTKGNGTIKVCEIIDK